MGASCRHAHGLHELRSADAAQLWMADAQTWMNRWHMPYYYPEQGHVPYPSESFDSGFIETPSETAASSEMASCAGVDDASDPGTATTETETALEDGNRSPVLLPEPRARHFSDLSNSSLRPGIFGRRWKDEEDEEDEEEAVEEVKVEEDRDDQEEEAIGRLLKAVRKLSRPKEVI